MFCFPETLGHVSSDLARTDFNETILYCSIHAWEG